MKVNKKKFILFLLIFLVIIFISIIAYSNSNSESNKIAYQTGQGLTNEQKKSNINDLIKKRDYDGAKTLLDNYYYYDKDLDRYSQYLKSITLCKEKNLDSLDKAGISLETSSKNNTTKNNTNQKEETQNNQNQNNENQKINSEFKKINDDIDAIGIDNLTEDQTVSFINKYMIFWDENKINHNEFHDKVVENLVKLKQKYYKLNKYYINNNMKVYKAKIGMTKAEVVAFTKYIQAKDINKTTTKYSTSEQYCYSNNDYLYFENGVLSTIQEN